jgi:Tol biopolymer transport system component
MKRQIKLLISIFSIIFVLGCEKDNSIIIGNYKILFISRRIDNSADWKMYLMNNDGTNQNEIIDLTVQYGAPVISHNNNKVAFVHLTESYKLELYIVNLNGSGLQLIDSSNQYIGSPDWSMDDTKLIYTKSIGDTTYGIYQSDCLGQTVQLISSSGGYFAVYSPDLKTITYNQSGNIYLMDYNGSNNKKLISNAGSFLWSPKGDKIAYLSSGDKRSPQISIANANGSSQKQLTSSYLPDWDSGFPTFGNYDPHWTPDESKIVFVSEINNGLPSIYIMNSDGTNQIRLTNTERRNEDPIITPDGKFIIFDSNRDLTLNSDIYIMDINGNNQKSLSNYKGDDCCPVIVKNN